MALRDGHFERSELDGLGVVLDPAGVVARAQDWHVPDPVWRHVDGRLAEW